MHYWDTRCYYNNKWLNSRKGEVAKAKGWRRGSALWSGFSLGLLGQTQSLILYYYYCSVAKSCPTLCNSMNCSMPGFPVLHYLQEFAQIHVHWVSDAIQASHPLAPFSSCLQSFPASGSFPMSQLFASGGQTLGSSASVLPMNIQSWFPLGLTGLRLCYFIWVQHCSTMVKSLPAMQET